MVTIGGGGGVRSGKGGGQRNFQSVTTKRLFKRGDLSKYVSANIPISPASLIFFTIIIKDDHSHVGG